MFADPDLVEAQEALVAAMETNAGATDFNARELKRANDAQSRGIASRAGDFQLDNYFGGARVGSIIY